MKVAISKATLQIPPTYFVVQHAFALRERFDFAFFTAAGEISDAQVLDGLSVVDVSRRVPLLAGRPYSSRISFAPLLGRVLARSITRWSPDLIHQHFANLSTGAVRAHQRTGVPLVLTVHGADVFTVLTSPRIDRGRSRLLWRHHRRTVLRVFEEATSILAVSEFLAGRAIAAGADPHKVRVHYQGIDTDLYVPRVRRRAEELPRVVFVGALSEAKGVRDLLAASLHLEARVPHQLVVAGDGPLRPLLDDAASKHRHIVVHGAVDRGRIRGLLDGATVLVLPTREWQGRREAAGLVTLEAQAMRVPVVVYDSGGAREMFDDGRTGVLVREGDVAALADAIRQIVELSTAEHEVMGERARDFVVRERSLAASAEELAAHYSEAVR